MGSFGARLKQEREKKGVTLDEVALATKIGTRMLRALEEERFNLLPGGIFNKGFVRAYARHLGLDEEQAIADYLDAAGLNTPPPQPVVIEELAASEAPAEIETKKAEPWTVPWGALAVVLLVIAFVFAVWGVYSREAKHDSHAPVPESPKVMEYSSLPSGGSAALSGQKESPLAPTQNLQQAAVAPSLGTVKPALTSGAPASTTAAPVITPQAPKAVQVLIRARENSWMSVTADGKSVMENNLLASGEKLIQARKEIIIKAGNIGALDFWFNGEKLPLQGDNNQVKTLTFNAKGLQPTAVKAQNTAPPPETVQP